MPAQQPIDRFTYSRNGGGNRDERCMIRVNIPGVTSDTQHTHYKIDVTNVQTQQTWQTAHRYSEFLALRNDLIAHFTKADKKCPGCINFEKVMKLFEFPSKRLFSSKNTVVINYRKKALRAFLALLASHTFTTAPKCPTCSGFAFTSVRDFLTDGPEVRGESVSSSSSGGERDTIRESIQVKNFTSYVAPPKMKPVNSDGAFIRDEDRRGTSTQAPPSKPSSMKSSSQGQKKAAAPKIEAVDLPSPLSSTASSTPSMGSPPTAPMKIDVHARENAESFLSFTGRTESMEASPKASNAGSTPRRNSSKKNKKNKSGSPHPGVQSQKSVKDSQDDEEFGSLNLDFMHNLSIAKKE